MSWTTHGHRAYRDSGFAGASSGPLVTSDNRMSKANAYSTSDRAFFDSQKRRSVISSRIWRESAKWLSWYELAGQAGLGPCDPRLRRPMIGDHLGRASGPRRRRPSGATVCSASRSPTGRETPCAARGHLLTVMTQTTRPLAVRCAHRITLGCNPRPLVDASRGSLCAFTVCLDLENRS